MLGKKQLEDGLYNDALNSFEQAISLDQEDPDLLDWFMEVGEQPRTELKEFILKLKHNVHG